MIGHVQRDMEEMYTFVKEFTYTMTMTPAPPAGSVIVVSCAPPFPNAAPLPASSALNFFIILSHYDHECLLPLSTVSSAAVIGHISLSTLPPKSAHAAQ